MAPPLPSVALLRGINVGGKRAVKMADLTAAFIAAGCADVRTYIQSGNVVFSHPSKAPADHLTACLTEAFGFEIPVVVRTARQLAGLVEHNPYPDLEPNKLGVAFLPPHGAVPTIAADACAPESFVVAGRDVYLDVPNGFGVAKLPAALRLNALGATLRNWRTVLKLVEMAS